MPICQTMCECWHGNAFYVACTLAGSQGDLFDMLLAEALEQGARSPQRSGTMRACRSCLPRQ